MTRPLIVNWKARLGTDQVRYKGIFCLRQDALTQMRRAGVPEDMIDRFMQEADVLPVFAAARVGLALRGDGGVRIAGLIAA